MDNPQNQPRWRTGLLWQNEINVVGVPPKNRLHLTEASRYTHMSKLLSDAHAPELVL
jgi:hypothetical protein